MNKTARDTAEKTMQKGSRNLFRSFPMRKTEYRRRETETTEAKTDKKNLFV
jgi:hypothetical protein